MQLLPAYLEAAAAAGKSVFKYIGCSKTSCFLCSNFLVGLGELGTRGCHGKIYELWGLPDLQKISQSQAKQVAKSLRKLESRIEQELLQRDVHPLPQTKESTIGGSSIDTVVPQIEGLSMSSWALAIEHLQNQRANWLFSAGPS